jgi:adenine phosphoribosyltransferase
VGLLRRLNVGGWQSVERFGTMRHVPSLIHDRDGPMNLADYVRSIPDFPKPGILFRDITPLLANGPALRETIRRLADHFRGRGIDVVGAAEARGFIFAAPLAIELGVGFVPFRKPGKLPFDTHAFHYELEYGTDSLEVHKDGFSPQQNVLLVDDLLATGGTMAACCKLVENSGAKVAGCAFVIELTSLAGKKVLAPYDTFSLLQYE